MRIPVQGMTLAQLQDVTTPKSVEGGNMEAFRDQLYDHQTYVAAGTTTLLNYFQAVNADVTLCNITQAGTMPDPEYFRIFYIQLDVLLSPSNATVPLGWRDLDRIIRIGRPVVTLTLQGKTYGPWLGRSIHGNSAPVTAGYSDGAGAGIVSHDWAFNGPADGGFCQDGGVWLTPKTSYKASVFWGNPTAVAADTLVGVTLDGIRYRAIR